MSAFDILALIIIGLWLYSKLCGSEAIHQLQEHLDEIELHQVSNIDVKKTKAARG